MKKQQSKPKKSNYGRQKPGYADQQRAKAKARWDEKKREREAFYRNFVF